MNKFSLLLSFLIPALKNNILSAFFRIILLFIFCYTLTACHLKPDAYDIHQRPIYFSDYRGKWILINYWASWCKPCWEEMPALNKIARRYNSQVVVFGVNYEDANLQTLQQLTQSMKINFPVLTSNPAPRFNIQSIVGLPSTAIINPQGQWVKTLTGPQTFTELQHMLGLA